MTQKLADRNTAPALLRNTLPTGAILVALIFAFGPPTPAGRAKPHRDELSTSWLSRVAWRYGL